MSSNTEQRAVRYSDLKNRYIATLIMGLVSVALFVSAVIMTDTKGLLGFDLVPTFVTYVATCIVAAYVANAVVAIGQGTYSQWRDGTFRAIAAVFAVQLIADFWLFFLL